MDHNLNVTARTIKFSGANLHYLALGIGFLDIVSKAQATKEKRNWVSSNLKTFVLQRALSSKKITHIMGKIFCKSCYLIRNLYLEYIKNSGNSIINRHIAQLKKWAMDLLGIS